MTQKTFAAVQAERFRSTSNNHKCRASLACDCGDAAAHPLAIGAVVTVPRFTGGKFVLEGIATVLRTSSEPDTYFVRLNGAGPRPLKRMIFPDYQRDPTRMIDLLNRHIKWDSVNNSALAVGERR